MKAIERCCECAYYSMRKHKCKRGAKDKGESTVTFYTDCPLDEAEIVQHGQWIKCEDKLPEMQEDVLMLFNANMAVGFLRDIDEGETFWNAYIDDAFYTDCDEVPLYWMPLPEPTKGR